MLLFCFRFFFVTGQIFKPNFFRSIDSLTKIFGGGFKKLAVTVVSWKNGIWPKLVRRATASVKNNLGAIDSWNIRRYSKSQKNHKKRLFLVF